MLDARQSGNLLHETLDHAVRLLEAQGSLASARPDEILAAIEQAAAAVAEEWQGEQAVPPLVVWRRTVRLWYVAATRARELLVLPKLDVAASKSSWNALMDFDLDGLPEIEIDQHPPGFEMIDGDPENAQTREVFANEAALVTSATTKLRWIAPSRDEDPTGPLDVTPVPRIDLGADGERAADAAVAVQGGRERGLIIHKLFEEALTGEITDDVAALVERAADLIQDLGCEPEADAANGLSAEEMGKTVAETLALPEIAAIRARLLPELPVYGVGEEDGVELATFGIVDALCIGEDGKPELVIDWKSDVAPIPSA